MSKQLNRETDINWLFGLFLSTKYGVVPPDFVVPAEECNRLVPEFIKWLERRENAHHRKMMKELA